MAIGSKVRRRGWRTADRKTRQKHRLWHGLRLESASDIPIKSSGIWVSTESGIPKMSAPMLSPREAIQRSKES